MKRNKCNENSHLFRFVCSIICWFFRWFCMRKSSDFPSLPMYGLYVRTHNFCYYILFLLVDVFFFLLQKFSSTVASSGCLHSLINLWKAHVCLSHYFMMMCPRFGIITHRDRATFCTSIGWMGNGRAGNCRSILLLYISWILFLFLFFYFFIIISLVCLFACFIRLRAILYAMGSSFAIIYNLDKFICNRANKRVMQWFMIMSHIGGRLTMGGYHYLMATSSRSAILAELCCHSIFGFSFGQLVNVWFKPK